jgi:hypothetical protein
MELNEGQTNSHGKTPVKIEILKCGSHGSSFVRCSQMFSCKKNSREIHGTLLTDNKVISLQDWY